MAGVLHDVWFLPHGRMRERVKISVTTTPEAWEKSLGWNTLDRHVREEFACLDDAKRAKLVVTSRPDEKVVVERKWSGGS